METQGLLAEDGVLVDAAAGGKAIRGGAVRVGSLLAQVALSLIAVPLMVRHLGPVDFGRYVTVSSIVFIITGFTEAGLMYLGVRRYVAHQGAERVRQLRNLAGLRIVLTLVGMAAALLFTWVTGADDLVVLGTAIFGLGAMLILVQGTYTIPLQAELRFGTLSAVELLRQLILTVVIVVFVALGAGLLPFFWASVASGAAALAATLALVRRRGISLVPAFELRVWRGIAREVLPYGLAAAVGLIYFRLAVVIMSYIATPFETGIYSTAFRIVEVANGIPWAAVSAGFPILVHAAGNDAGRMRYALQRMFEVATMAGIGIALGIALGASFAIDVVAGPGFEEAVPVLRLLGLALVTCFLVATWSFALLSLQRYRDLLIANALAAAIAAIGTFALVPPLGAEGAAIATVVGEASLALAYLVALARADRDLAPRFAFLWKIALAAAAGALAVLLPLHPAVGALAGLGVYVTVLIATRAVPAELLQAVRRRAT